MKLDERSCDLLDMSMAGEKKPALRRARAVSELP